MGNADLFLLLFCFQTSLMRLISAIRLLVCLACLSCNIRYTRALTEGSSASFGTFTKRWGLDLIHKKNKKKFKKIYNCLSHQIAWEIMLLLVNNFQGKNITESQNRRNFESVRVICNLNSCHNFAQLCTTLHNFALLCTTLHSCYMRIHSFSANQKRVIFSCTLLRNKRFLAKIHVLVS